MRAWIGLFVVMLAQTPAAADSTDLPVSARSIRIAREGKRRPAPTPLRVSRVVLKDVDFLLPCSARVSISLASRTIRQLDLEIPWDYARKDPPYSRPLLVTTPDGTVTAQATVKVTQRTERDNSVRLDATFIAPLALEGVPSQVSGAITIRNTTCLWDMH